MTHTWTALTLKPLPIPWCHTYSFTCRHLTGLTAQLTLTFRYLDIYVTDRFNQNIWYQLKSDVRQSRWIVFFGQDASRWWATTCTSPRRKQDRLAAHCCLGHPHTLTNPSETSREALGQLLATSSVKHAGKCGKLAWEKGSSNLSTSGECVAGARRAWCRTSPRRQPIIPALSLKKVHFYNIQSPA